MLEKYIEICKKLHDQPNPDASYTHWVIPKKITSDDNVRINVTLKQKIALQKILLQYFDDHWKMKNYLQWCIDCDTKDYEIEKKFLHDMSEAIESFVPTPDVEIDEDL